MTGPEWTTTITTRMRAATERLEKVASKLERPALNPEALQMAETAALEQIVAFCNVVIDKARSIAAKDQARAIAAAVINVHDITSAIALLDRAVRCYNGNIRNVEGSEGYMLVRAAFDLIHEARRMGVAK